MRLIYSSEAVKALRGIYEFLRRKNERAAAVIHNEILDKAEILSSFPQMAPIDPVMEGGIYRSLIVHRIYKVIYRIEEQIVFIVDIWDCRQDPKTLKKRTAKQK